NTVDPRYTQDRLRDSKRRLRPGKVGREEQLRQSAKQSGRGRRHAPRSGTLGGHMTHEEPVQGRVVRWLEDTVIGPIQDFHDPRQEWRRLFAELLGTFFLVLVAAGAGMMGRAFPNAIGRSAAVVAPGLMVMAIILFMGKVSGA